MNEENNSRKLPDNALITKIVDGNGVTTILDPPVPVRKGDVISVRGGNVVTNGCPCANNCCDNPDIVGVDHDCDETSDDFCEECCYSQCLNCGAQCGCEV